MLLRACVVCYCAGSDFEQEVSLPFFESFPFPFLLSPFAVAGAPTHHSVAAQVATATWMLSSLLCLHCAVAGGPIKAAIAIPSSKLPFGAQFECNGKRLTDWLREGASEREKARDWERLWPWPSRTKTRAWKCRRDGLSALTPVGKIFETTATTLTTHPSASSRAWHRLTGEVSSWTSRSSGMNLELQDGGKWWRVRGGGQILDVTVASNENTWDLRWPWREMNRQHPADASEFLGLFLWREFVFVYACFCEVLFFFSAFQGLQY